MPASMMSCLCPLCLQFRVFLFVCNLILCFEVWPHNVAATFIVDSVQIDSPNSLYKRKGNFDGMLPTFLSEIVWLVLSNYIVSTLRYFL